MKNVEEFELYKNDPSQGQQEFPCIPALKLV